MNIGRQHDCSLISKFASVANAWSVHCEHGYIQGYVDGPMEKQQQKQTEYASCMPTLPTLDIHTIHVYVCHTYGKAARLIFAGVADKFWWSRNVALIQPHFLPLEPLPAHIYYIYNRNSSLRTILFSLHSV